MDLEAVCDPVVPINVQFVNETEDIVNSTTCWDGNRDSADSDECGENLTRRAPIASFDGLHDIPSGKRHPRPGKKTMGRVKIKMEYIKNKVRRYTTFSKRKTGIMKKAYELSALTGTQVMLLVASETGHVYTFATRKLQPMITSENGKALIQTCLNSPDPLPLSRLSSGQALLQPAPSQSTDSVNHDAMNVNSCSSEDKGADQSTDEKNNASQKKVAEMTCSTGVLANTQDVQLQCVFNHATGCGESSAPTLLPIQMNNAVINSSSTSSSMMLAVSSSSVGSARTEQVQQVASLLSAQNDDSSLQSVQYIYCQVSGTNQIISVPVERFKENTIPQALAVEQRPLTLLNVGSGNANAASAPTTLMYPPSFVLASSSSSLSTDGYLLGLPNTPAYSIPQDSSSLPAVNGLPQQLFTIPLSAAQSQIFQSAHMSTSPSTGCSNKLVIVSKRDHT